MTREDEQGLFKEDVYAILQKANEGEKYRKRNTDEAIRRILQDERLLKCLRGRKIVWEHLNIIFPEEISRIINESKRKRHNLSSMVLKEGSLELRIEIQHGYYSTDYDSGSSDWRSWFTYEARAPLVLYENCKYPVADFANPFFNYKGMEFYFKNRNNSKGNIELIREIIALFNQTKKAFFKLKGKRIRVSDLIGETGKDLLEKLGEQVSQYRAFAERKIGEVKIINQHNSELSSQES